MDTGFAIWAGRAFKFFLFCVLVTGWICFGVYYKMYNDLPKPLPAPSNNCGAKIKFCTTRETEFEALHVQLAEKAREIAFYRGLDYDHENSEYYRLVDEGKQEEANYHGLRCHRFYEEIVYWNNVYRLLGGTYED